MCKIFFYLFRYFVLTSKHHEGFTLFPSNYSWNWNSVDVGPHMDMVGQLAQSIRDEGIKFGLYYSLFEWFNPIYLKDKSSLFSSQDYLKVKVNPELEEIITRYKPEVLWSDGDWEASYQYWNSTQFLAWLYNSSPVKDTIVTNDRWGVGAMCKHGDFLTCSDRFSPGVLLNKKWESCMTIDKESWGYRRLARLDDYLKVDDLIEILVKTISCGGNLLLNVGPTHDGRITPIFEERLLGLGKFIDVNEEAIFGTKPWIFQNDTKTPDIW
uniref:alpha-L-fucosidase n=2 Tax=Romanomermis culicivorax TaxID=13658 RepID=A0A915KVL1_ROMCU